MKNPIAVKRSNTRSTKFDVSLLIFSYYRLHSVAKWGRQCFLRHVSFCSLGGGSAWRGDLHEGGSAWRGVCLEGWFAWKGQTPSIPQKVDPLRRQTPLPKAYPAPSEGRAPLPQYGQPAIGTHPTGMHSCFGQYVPI